MKKGDKQIRIGAHVFNLNPEGYQIVQDYKHLYNFKTDGEALAALLKENYHTRLYLKYFTEHRDATQEEPFCLRRFIYEGSFFCAKNAPHVYILPTLDICKACRWKLSLEKWKYPSVSTAPSLKPQDRPKEVLSELRCELQDKQVKMMDCERCNTPCKKRELWLT